MCARRRRACSAGVVVEHFYGLASEPAELRPGDGNYQVRPFFDGQSLRTIVQVPAGRSLSVLVRLLTEIPGSTGDPWDYIAAATEVVGTTDLEADLAFFAGPFGDRGSIGNIREDNLTVGSLFVAAFRWMAQCYEQCATRLSPEKAWDRVVFSGGLRPNDSNAYDGGLDATRRASVASLGYGGRDAPRTIDPGHEDSPGQLAYGRIKFQQPRRVPRPIRHMPRLLFITLCLTPAAFAAEPAVDFNRDVRPILSDKCFACHGPDEKHRKAEAAARRREGRQADRGGRVVVPGKPDESELVARITRDGRRPSGCRRRSPARRSPPAEVDTAQAVGRGGGEVRRPTGPTCRRSGTRSRT